MYLSTALWLTFNSKSDRFVRLDTRFSILQSYESTNRKLTSKLKFIDDLFLGFKLTLFCFSKGIHSSNNLLFPKRRGIRFCSILFKFDLKLIGFRFRLGDNSA